MTEPIRLFAVVDSDGKPVFDYELAMAFDTKREAEDNTASGDRVVELTEVRRCGTCRSFCGGLPPVCESWGNYAKPDEWCSRYEEKTYGPRNG